MWGAVAPIAPAVATLLLVEDSASQREAIRRALREGGLSDRILEASDGLEGLRLLLSEPVDLVICDLELPRLAGDKLLYMARSQSQREVAFLVLTGVDDPARRARLLRDGACDVVTKPFHDSDLVARVELRLQVMRLQRELVAKNRMLEHLSTTDALTGLRNRRFLEEHLEVEFLRARRYRTPLAVVLADLDHFKEVNDRHGHAAGDAALRAVARQLQRRLRATDVGGRYGGEEFLAVLGHQQLEGARVFAERWRADVAAQTVATDEGERVGVRMSVGIASYSAEMPSAGTLLARADEALYRAKTAGRDCVVAAGGPEEEAVAAAG